MKETIEELGTWGKTYASVFERSLVGSGSAVFALWMYCIANARPPDGLLELNPVVLAAIIGDTVENMEAALKKLCSHDKHSHTQGNNGQRLEQVRPYTYRMVNWQLYRGARSPVEWREYWRRKQAERRARVKAAKMKVDAMDDRKTRSIHI